MTSTVDICNYALNYLGANNITALDENSKPARIINQKYNSVRDTLFRAHPWNCLLQRTELSKSTTAPAFGYSNYFPLPTDPYCLRVLEFSNGSLSYPKDSMISNSGDPVFAIEGRNLVTDEDTAKIKYVARITDPNEYDANLIDVLAARLAFEICYSITGSTSMVQLTAGIFDDKLREARFIDGTEGASPKIEASDFIEARM
tara:strand:- start:1764 stop:2369 length:606 start_codon:yes stop_codon:yes gene_type:complete